MRYIYAFLLSTVTSLCLCFSAQAQQYYRLKAIAHDRLDAGTGQMYQADSIYYYYDSKRTAVLTHDALMKKLAVDQWFNTFNKAEPELRYDSSVTTMKDPNGNKQLAFSAQGFDAFDNLSWQRTNFGVDSFKYTGLRLVSSYSAKSGITTNYVYDNGQLDTIWFQSNTAPDQCHVFSYNTFGQLVKRYEYTSGRLTGDVIYSYGRFGQLAGEMKEKEALSGNIEPYFYTGYSYNTVGDLDTVVTYEWDDATTSWRPYDKRFYWFDAGRRTVMDIYAQRGSTADWDTIARHRYTYNSGGLIETIIGDNWDAATQAWSQKAIADSSEFKNASNYRFYYEANYPTTITNVKAGNDNLRLFPSPASAFINVEMNKEIDKPFSAAIYDMQGRLVRDWKEPAVAHYFRSIPVTELPAGTYLIKFTMTDEQVTKQFTVMR